MNDRELAAIIWLGIGLAWALTNPDIRRSLGQVVVSAVQPKIIVPLLVMTAYGVGLIYAGGKIGLWNTNLMSDTVAWAIGTGLVLFGNSVKVFTRGGSFKRLVLAAVGLTVFVEGFVNLYVFPLVAELVLLPVVLFFAAMSAYAGTDTAYSRARKLVDGLVSLFGFALIVYVCFRLVAGWEESEPALVLQKLALPVWLTLGALPFVTVMGVWSNYDAVFSKLRGATEDRRRRLRARLALFSGLHLRAREVGGFNGIWCKKLAEQESLREARAVVRRFRAVQRASALPS